MSDDCFFGITYSEQSSATARTLPRNVSSAASPQHVGRRVNIRQYRPDYTWNRGGRLKELRIRY